MATGNASFTEHLRAIDRELGFEQGEIRGEVGVPSQHAFQTVGAGDSVMDVDRDTPVLHTLVGPLSSGRMGPQKSQHKPKVGFWKRLLRNLVGP